MLVYLSKAKSEFLARRGDTLTAQNVVGLIPAGSRTAVTRVEKEQLAVTVPLVPNLTRGA